MVVFSQCYRDERGGCKFVLGCEDDISVSL